MRSPTFWLTLQICLLVFAAGPVVSQAQVNEQQSSRASFLQHIAHYTIYPSHILNAGRFHFCFLEDEEQAHSDILSQKEQLQIKERQVTVVVLNLVTDPQIQHCHLLFVSKEAESELLYQQLSKLNKHLVSVGETAEFIDKGGMMSVVPLQSKMKILGNKQQFENTSLKFSSLLLKRVSFR